MTLAKEMCPEIRQMLFMFQDRYTCPLSIVVAFQYLQELELWGGDFYADEFEVVIHAIGNNLTRLDFHHFEGIDVNAITLLTVYCTNLQHLGFSGCGFKEHEGETEGFQEQDRWRQRDIEERMEPFLELKCLSISCPCPPQLLVTILKQAINLRRLLIGLNCPITDDIFDLVFVHNRFQYLEEFEVRKSDDLTIKTVSNLLLYCDNIRSILDLSYWSKVSREEFFELSQHMTENNIDMRLTESIDRSVSLYEICQSQLKERYGRVEWFDGE